MAKDNEEFYTSKHKRLSLIASLANLFSWLVLVVYLVTIVANIVQFNNYREVLNFDEVIQASPGFIINMVIENLRYGFVGVMYFLLLKSAALGLNMIIETDLNYRDQVVGESHG